MAKWDEDSHREGILAGSRRRLPPPQLILVTAWDTDKRVIEFISPSPRLSTALASEYGTVESQQLGPDLVHTLHISLLYEFDDVLAFLTALAELTGSQAVMPDW